MEIIHPTIFSKYSEIICGISTRNGGVSSGVYGLNMSFNVGDIPENVQENRRRFFSILGIHNDNVAFPLQQHTNNVQSVSAAGKYQNCDALVTSSKKIFIAISVADCVPVMLYDFVTNTVAGIHAGWKGTASKIVFQTIYQMKKEHNAEPKNIIAYIGPAAGKCCYEVGEEVATLFSSQLYEKKTNGKFLLDVKSANKKQLLESGVQEYNIEIHPSCTICSQNLFHSYRRDAKNSGRMLAVIGMK